jgi:hypothetical protein
MMVLSASRCLAPSLRKAVRIVAVAVSLLVATELSFSWIYPEHRDIAIVGIQSLDADRRAVLDQLWNSARAGHEGRLCAMVADATQGRHPQCLDYAAWPAIAGDHSCSGANMLHNILETDWILGVADVAAELKEELAAATNAARRINALRDSDIKLQGTDPEYATRAGSNNVHFLLARPSPATTGREYARACLIEGAEINAIGAYSWYHISALLKAGRLAREDLTPEERSALALAALADEAFSLHFLEDVFAAGHAAGTWGSAAIRKGTHDYYNEWGLEVVTWSGKTMVLTGDAWMREEDAERAGHAVRTSLEQLLDAARGVGPASHLVAREPLSDQTDTFNVCKTDTMPPRDVDRAVIPLLVDDLGDTPIPGLAEGLGALPRARAEIGPFVGLVSGLRVEGLGGGFGELQDRAGVVGGLAVAVRLGLGLEGVLHSAGDGLVFLDVGFSQDGSSTMKYGSSPFLEQAGAVASAIPGRGGYVARIRMPFFLLPFDLLYAGPFVFLASPEAAAKMAVTAGNGGLIPWQAGIATPLGRLQFILGREVGVTFHGYSKEEDRMLVPVEASGEERTILIGVRSVKFDFPLVEYRPFRTFSLEQSSSLMVQFNVGVDIPTRLSVIAPVGSPEPELRAIWFIGLRMAFDWRYYW